MPFRVCLIPQESCPRIILNSARSFPPGRKEKGPGARESACELRTGALLGSLSFGRAWQTGSGTSRAIIPLKPKAGVSLRPAKPKFCWNSMARLNRQRKSSGFEGYGLHRQRNAHVFVSERDFTGCGKTHVLYQGTTLQVAEKLLLCIRARL